MISQQKKLSLIQCIIASSCLFPLFFLVIHFLLGGLFFIFYLVELAGSFFAFSASFCLQKKTLLHSALWFWRMMSLVPLTVILIFHLCKWIPDASILLFPCLGIQFLLPTIHIVLETQKRKKIYRYFLICIYVFSLSLGSAILFLGKECHFEFFPIAALSGILLELSFLKSTENVSNELTKSKSLNSKSSDKG